MFGANDRTLNEHKHERLQPTAQYTHL